MKIQSSTPLEKTEADRVMEVLAIFRESLHREAVSSGAPAEHLRLLKCCRLCLVRTTDALYFVACHYPADELADETIYLEDLRETGYDDDGLEAAERVAVPFLISGDVVDLITLRFPSKIMSAPGSKLGKLTAPVAKSYLKFECTWVSQLRKLGKLI